MNQKASSPDQLLPVSELIEVHKVCQQFEAEWKAGRQPKAADFLGDTPEPKRAELKRELEALEVEYRQKTKKPTLEAFGDTLANSGLMTRAEVQTFLTTLPADKRPADAETLAREMFKQGKLTKFQAQAVFQGKTRGLVVGNYVVLDKLGQGGMGQVYKARHKRMERIVAIKMLPSSASRSAEAIARFQRKVKAAAKLSHPNIVTAHDADEANGVNFLVMEHVEGQDLKALVAGRGPLPLAQAVDCVVQAAKGLEYAHRQGVVHRDIKPSNLLLDKSGAVKVLDMGLARIENAVGGVDDGLTRSGQVMGTLDYMAPEQALNTHHADARSDIYSLGCTLHYLLTGRAPFAGDTVTQKIIAHRERQVPSLRAVRPDVPDWLDRVFQKMLAKRPEDRQQTMGQVMVQLQQQALPQTTPAVSVRPGPENLAETLSLRQGHVETSSEQVAAQDFSMEEFALPPLAARHRSGKAKKSGSGLLGRLSKRQKIGTAVATGVIFAFLMLGIALTLRTKDGMLEIVSDDPNVKVEVKQNGELVEVVDAKSRWKISRRPGEYQLAVQGGTDKFELDQNSVVVKSGVTVKVTVTLKPPSPIPNPKSELSNFKSEISNLRSPLPAIGSLIGPDGKWKLPPGAPAPAVAPFDETKAEEHQEAWAKYLGVPVELTNSIGVKLDLIPPGEFEMGSPQESIDDELKNAPKDDKWRIEALPGEGPRHHVRITKPFYLGMYPVTQQEYQRVMNGNPSVFCASGNHKDQVVGQNTKRFPVENVNWEDTDKFCSRLSEMPDEKAAGRRYCLPTEAQWEYACRAGTTGRNYFVPANAVPTPPLTPTAIAAEKKLAEKLLAENAWFVSNSGGRPHAVGGRRANAWRLYDMNGDVWQWCQDWYAKDYYAKSPVENPSGPVGGSDRVLRGGSWYFGAGRCRSASRDYDSPGYRNSYLGLRVGLVLPDKPAEQAAVPSEPIVRPTPVHLDLKPDTKAWDLKPGSLLNPASLVLRPAAIKGLRSWTLETCDAGGGSRAEGGAGQLSPDDQLYATGGHDGVIRFLDPATGKLRIAVVNPELEIMSLTWSPDNAYVAVGSLNGVVRIWNVATGTLVIGPTLSSTSLIPSLAWSPDGTLLAIAHRGESAVALWDVREARQSAVLQEQDDVNQSVHFLVWSADGKQLMATTDLAVRIWDVTAKRLVQTLDSQDPKDNDARIAAAWSPDGKRIATLCHNKKVKFFDSTYKLAMSIDAPGAGGASVQASIAWSPDGRHLACASWNESQVLNTSSGLPEFGIIGFGWGDGGLGLSWSKDGARLLSTHYSGAVSAIDAHSGKLLWRLAARLTTTDICISPDGPQYAIAQERLSTWDAVQGAPVHDYGEIFPGRGQIAWSKDGRLAVAKGWGGDMGGRIWDPGEAGQSHLYRDGAYRSAAWSPDGKTLARGGRDVLILASGWEDPHQVFHADADAEVAKLAWGGNSSILAAGLDNNKILILEMPSGRVLRTLERKGLEGGIRFLAMLPDGRLVAASHNGAVSVWNSKWETVRDLVRLKKTVRQGNDLVRVELNVNDGAMPTPAGLTTIAFATSDGIVLWDADKQAVHRTIGTGPMYSVAWSFPLHRLIAAQEDRLAVYDVSSDELLASQMIWYGPGKHLFLSPEGHMRCSPAMSEDVVYVALTDDGRQVTLRPAEFAAAYGWKNDPEKIRLSSAMAADKPRGGKAEKAK